MESPEDDKEILRLLRENSVLVKENNALLKQIHRWTVWGMLFKIVWYALLIGLPFALYFYVFEPYFTALGADYEAFRNGINEVPGLKSLQHLLPTVGEK